MSLPGAHRTLHPEFQEGCLGCKISTQHVAPSATESRGSGAQVAIDNQRDKRLHVDRDAYQRLRRDGLQPSSVDGSARLEQSVKDQIEIDYKIPLKERDIPRIKEIQSEVAAGNYSRTLPR